MLKYLRELRERFGRSVGDTIVGAHVDGLNPWRTMLIAHLDGDGEVAAAAEVALAFGGIAEAAFSVDAERRGLGRALLARALLMAHNRGARHVTVSFLAENRAMRRLAVGAGASLSNAAGECKGLIALGPATPASMVSEVVTEAAAWAGTWRTWARRFRPRRLVLDPAASPGT